MLKLRSSLHLNASARVAPLAAATRSGLAKQQRSAALLTTQAVAAPFEETETAAQTQAASLQARVASLEAAAAKPAEGGSAGRVVLESAEELRSTWEHRAWVGGTTLLLAATVAEGVSRVDDAGGGAAVAAAAAAAYVLSDLGTGIFHWAVDNYGTGATPVFGSQIAAFQGHHQRPWTITEREFCNNVHQVFRPAAPFAAALLASSLVAPPAWSVCSATLTFLACMSQQFHAWSHMKKSELHPAVSALQDAGLLISRKSHGAHHKAPFEGNYCIVSGLWNPLLDADGSDNGFFRKLERAVHGVTGVGPRCWLPLEEQMKVMERPA